MKANTIFKLCTLILSLVVTVSCVQDDEFDVPKIEVESIEIPADQLLTITGMRALYEQALVDGEQVYTFPTDVEQYFVAYVISSDATGNFFEELILQDKAANPTIGIKVLINTSPLSNTYQIGRKVFVKVTGLTVGVENGVFTIGLRDGNSVEQLAEADLRNVILRDDEVEEIVPLPIAISDFSDAKTNLFVRLTDVQFNRNEVLNSQKTYAAEPGDEFDGERVLESCASGASTIFSTSTFADFKGLLLPDGRGTMDAVLTRNFFGDTFNLVINTPNDINFDSTDRCDPDEIDCGLATSTGSNILFSDFFETQNEGSPIAGNGWTNFSEEGTRSWRAYFDDGSNASLGISANIGSFMSGDDSTVNWLITPQINFDAQDGETLNFKTSNSFSDGSTLELLISTDWDGNEANIASATWNLLPAAYIVMDDDFFGDWLDSGNVDLSCVNGSGYIAWKYAGSGDETADGTYELDEIVINAN